MEPNDARRLNDEESDYVFRRALELQEAAGKMRSPADVLAALQELGVQPDFARQALAELQGRSLEPVAGGAAPSVPDPGRGNGWRHFRRMASYAVLSLALVASAVSTATWKSRQNDQARVRSYVRGVSEQIRDRQEFYRNRTGEYASQVEDLGKIEETNQDATIEMLGGGKSYLAHVEHKWRKVWCEVRAEEGSQPETTCHF